MNHIFHKDSLQANLGFVQSQTTTIETQVYNARFQEIIYPGLIPVDNSAPEWTKTITYYSGDVVGNAQWVADMANDIPTVGVAKTKAETEVAMAAIGYDYGLEEVNQAMMLSQNLPNEKAMAARKVYEHFVQNLAFKGDTTKGWYGLVNNPNVTAGTATTGDWATATSDQIRKDINELITSVMTDTNYISMANTLLLPTDKFTVLFEKTVNDNTTETLFNFIQRSNAYTAMTGQPLAIRGIPQLKGAGAGGADRMLAYRNSAEVLKMHVPMRHRFLPLQVEGLRYVVPGIFRVGPLDIRLPKEVAYSDGI